jgi:hypothetical protein
MHKVAKQITEGAVKEGRGWEGRERIASNN